MTNRLYRFAGGPRGAWLVRRQSAVAGEAIAAVERLQTLDADGEVHGATWTLRGITSNERYVSRAERPHLVARQQGLGRPEATWAALIPIRKSAAWWQLTQDERREVFEEQSHHIRIGPKHLPPVARRLHHCRDLSQHEAFDFLTWFEYAPSYESAFDDMVAELRASTEWRFVERETDIRLSYEGARG